MCTPRRRPRAFCLSGGKRWPWDRTTPDLPLGPSGGRPSLPTAQDLKVGNCLGPGVAKVGDESSLRKRGAVSGPLRSVPESAYCPLGAVRTEATVPNRKRPLDRRFQALRGVFDAVAVCPREDSNLHGRKGHVTLNHARLPIPPLGHQNVDPPNAYDRLKCSLKLPRTRPPLETAARTRRPQFIH
jgi:hypothetical protein